MSRGILFVCWSADQRRTDRGRWELAELGYAVMTAARTGLPTCLFLEKRDRSVPRQWFTHVVEVDFAVREEPRRSTVWNRKTFALLSSPFAETLYVDSDCSFVAGDLSYAFDKVARHGLCMAFGGWELGISGTRRQGYDRHLIPAVATLLPRDTSYVPLYNGAVIFYRRGHNKARATMEQADRYCLHGNGHARKHVPLDDQMAITISCQRLGFDPFLLDHRVWNARTEREGKPVYPQTKILHSYRAVKTYCADQGIPEEEFVRRLSNQGIAL